MNRIYYLCWATGYSRLRMMATDDMPFKLQFTVSKQACECELTKAMGTVIKLNAVEHHRLCRAVN